MSSSIISTSSQITILPDEHKSNDIENTSNYGENTSNYGQNYRENKHNGKYTILQRKILCGLAILFMTLTMFLSMGSMLAGIINTGGDDYLYIWLILQSVVHFINFVLLFCLITEIATMEVRNVSFKFLFFVSIYHTYTIISTFIGFVLFWINYDLIPNDTKSVMYCDLIYNCIFIIIIEIYKYFILFNNN